MKAIWNGSVLAESEATVVVEGNHYFPPKSINSEYFRKSDRQTACGWKGVASYYDIEVGGEINQNAAWYYPDTLPAADAIKGYVAFWNGVTVEGAKTESGKAVCESGNCAWPV